MEKIPQPNSNFNDGSQSEIVQLLAQVAVLSVLTDGERAQLAKKARMVAYGTGEFIVRQGEPGKSLFIVHTGVCEVFVLDPQGHGKKVAQTKRGGFFGEMSLLTGEPHTATVRAMEDTTLVAINKVIFASILEANPAISEELGKVLAMRQKKLAELTGSPGDEKHSSSNMIARIKSFFRIE